jgi:hypothetical protein
MTLKEQLAQAEVRTRKKEAELDKSLDEVIALIGVLQEENEKFRSLLRRTLYPALDPGGITLADEIEEALK